MIDWVYVNGLLCRDEWIRNKMVMYFFTRGETVDIQPVPRDERGRYIIPLNDPEEQ